MGLFKRLQGFAGRSGFSVPAAVACGLAFLLCLAVVAAGVEDYSEGDGRLYPDGWLHQITAEQLYKEGGWYNHRLPRIEPPAGIELQWSRVMDVLLLVPTLLFNLFLPFKEALFAAGFLYPPLVLLLSIFVVFRLVDRLVPDIWARCMFMLVLFYTHDDVIQQYYTPLRSDHHVFLTLCLLCSLLYLVKGLDAPPTRRNAVPAGIWTGLGIWVSVEFFVPFALMISGLGLVWVFAGSREGAARLLRFYLWTVAGVLAIALLLEQPPGTLMQRHYDSLSVLHLAISVVAALWGEAVYRLSGRVTAAWPRAVLGGGTGLAAVAAMVVLDPQLLQGPMANVSPALRAVFLLHTLEMQPLVKPYYILVGTLAVTGFILRYRLQGGKGGTAGRVILPGVVFTGMTLGTFVYARWHYYLPLLAALGMTMLAFAIKERLAAGVLQSGHWKFSLFTRGGAAWAIAVIIIVLLTFTPLLFVGENRDMPAITEKAAGKRCGKAAYALVQYNRMRRYIGEKPVTMLTTPALGIQLLYWTPHAILACNCHTNEAGYLDLNAFFYADSPETAQEMVEKWGVQQVFFCPDTIQSTRFYPFRDNLDPKHPFVKQLAVGKYPDWLQPVADYPGKESGLLWFTVRK